MRTPFESLSIVAILSSCALTAHAQSTPAVVELFTSQGCSSCPPADAYVGELAQRSDVLALTFHVDYWDDLGWRDRFGLPEAVVRQRGYAKNLRLASVFTPQLVIDGRESFVGSDRRSIDRALATPRTGATIRLSISEGDLLVRVDAQKNVPVTEVMLFPFERSAVSPIGRGENSGRTLAEFNIVRGLRTIGRWDGQERQYRVPLSSLPPDATHVAVVIQSQSLAPMLGAASLPLR